MWCGHCSLESSRDNSCYSQGSCHGIRATAATQSSATATVGRMESGSCRCCSVAAAGSGSTRNASSVCSIHCTAVTGMRIPDTTSLFPHHGPNPMHISSTPGLTTYCPVSTLMSYTSVFGHLDSDDEGSTKCFPENLVSHPRRLETEFQHYYNVLYICTCIYVLRN